MTHADINILICGGIITVISATCFSILARKNRGNYYGNGYVLTVILTSIIGLLFPYFHHDPINICLLFTGLGAIFGLICWPSIYTLRKSTQSFREKLYGKHKEKHPWVNKMIYLPDDSRYYGANENKNVHSEENNEEIR